MLNYKHLYYFRTVAKAGALNRAAEKLHLTPQTLSGQISAFEERLGVALFRCCGRRLVLSVVGRTALIYADDIFQVGAELEDALQNRLAPRAHPFRVGIADVVPKAIAYQLLAPALALAEPVKLVCREDRLEQLAAELSIHRLDMVLADRPLPSTMDIKGYSHPLGECGIAFLAARAIADTLEAAFPANLHGVPFLIPGEDSALRVTLLRWLERKDIQPAVVGGFGASALMSAFGHAGDTRTFYCHFGGTAAESSSRPGGQRSGATAGPAAGQLSLSVNQHTASAGGKIRKCAAQWRRKRSTARSLLTSPCARAVVANSMNFWSSGSRQRGRSATTVAGSNTARA